MAQQIPRNPNSPRSARQVNHQPPPHPINNHQPIRPPAHRNRYLQNNLTILMWVCLVVVEVVLIEFCFGILGFLFSYSPHFLRPLLVLVQVGLFGFLSYHTIRSLIAAFQE